MKDDRLELRFWVVGMSGTIINSNPLDIEAATEIIGSPSWKDKEHVHHTFSSKRLKAMKKAIAKRQELGKGASSTVVEDAEVYEDTITEFVR